MATAGDYPDRLVVQADRGDTWDRLAFRYYAEETEQDRLLAANPGLRGVLVFEGGELVTVPKVTDEELLPAMAGTPPWRA